MARRPCIFHFHGRVQSKAADVKRAKVADVYILLGSGISVPHMTHVKGSKAADVEI